MRPARARRGRAHLERPVVGGERAGVQAVLREHHGRRVSVALIVAVGSAMYQPLRPFGASRREHQRRRRRGRVGDRRREVDEPVFECASVFEHVTVVEPFGNVEPEAGAHVELPSPSTASCDAGGVNVTTAPAGLVASTPVMSACVSTTGAVVSCTITWNDAAVWLPACVDAVTETVVSPIGNVESGGGGAGHGRSRILGVRDRHVVVDLGAAALVASAVIVGGTVTVGPSTSGNAPDAWAAARPPTIGSLILLSSVLTRDLRRRRAGDRDAVARVVADRA